LHKFVFFYTLEVLLHENKKLHHLCLVKDGAVGDCDRVFGLDSLKQRLEIQPPIETPVLVLSVDKRQEVFF
jgi:hypothetical protein